MTDKSNSSRLSEKVAIVTGGGTGIGRAAAQALVNQGAKVLVVGRRESPIKELADKYDGAMGYLQADISQSGSSKSIIDTAVETFGRLDILVNNAGTAVIKPIAETTDEEIEQMLSVNIKGMLALSRDAIPALQESQGSIINISSVAGQSAVPGFSTYGATKSAIDRITKILAVELGSLGIRVNVVSPGLTKTDMLEATPPEVIEKMVNEATALRRVGTPEDVAQSIAWLSGNDSGWITGQILQASGGFLLS
ncbi:MAG TPA: SDR family oxidoreductase [Gammaproteobacteria bacterium]|nr:SDR family oxidoreductase [Gammaproteobacteria bacterium]